MKNNCYKTLKLEYKQTSYFSDEEKLNFLLQRLNEMLKNDEINDDKLEIKELKRKIKALKKLLLVEKNKFSPTSLSKAFSTLKRLLPSNKKREIEKESIRSISTFEQDCFRFELLYLFYFYIYPDYGLHHIDEKDFDTLSNKALLAVLENQVDKMQEERAELEKNIYENSRFQQEDDDHFKSNADNDTDTFERHSESCNHQGNSYNESSNSYNNDSDSYSSNYSSNSNDSYSSSD